jgi:hypothetical protein
VHGGEVCALPRAEELAEEIVQHEDVADDGFLGGGEGLFASFVEEAGVVGVGFEVIGDGFIEGGAGGGGGGPDAGIGYLFGEAVDGAGGSGAVVVEPVELSGDFFPGPIDDLIGWIEGWEVEPGAVAGALGGVEVVVPAGAAALGPGTKGGAGWAAVGGEDHGGKS